MKTAGAMITGAANALAVAGLSILLVLAAFTLLDGLLRAFANYPLDLVREIGDLVAICRLLRECEWRLRPSCCGLRSQPMMKRGLVRRIFTPSPPTIGPSMALPYWLLV